MFLLLMLLQLVCTAVALEVIVRTTRHVTCIAVLEVNGLDMACDIGLATQYFVTAWYSAWEDSLD